MAFPATVYRVMLASPSDVASERAIVREVLAEWNAAHAERRGLVILPLGWEVDVAPEMGDAPQAIIDKRILNEADLVIGIFWTRIGTPTARYASGAVEEIEEHVAAGKPTMMYFSTAPVPLDSIDPAQYDGLKTFRDSCKSRGLYETYASLEEFRRDLSRQLQIRMNEAPFQGLSDAGAPPTASGTVSSPPQLSNEARSLLVAASQDPAGVILRMPYGGGTTIQVNDTVFTDDSSARSVALWESAIEELETNGFAKTGSDAREVFSLTRKGFETGDALRAK
jgi:hypothetical protein